MAEAIAAPLILRDFAALMRANDLHKDVRLLNRLHLFGHQVYVHQAPQQVRCPVDVIKMRFDDPEGFRVRHDGSSSKVF